MNRVQIEERALDTLTLYENNPRRNERAVDAVMASIREFGFKVPIVANANGVIVTGHTRYKAAQKLGLSMVPVIVADDLTPEQIQAFRLADNKVGEIASWNEEMLAEELSAIAGIDMRELGFTDKDFEELLLPDDDEYALPDSGSTAETRTHEGELWQLGAHRLFVGDATKAEDVRELMGQEEADLWPTDPPYNVDYHGGTDEAMSIANDNMDKAQFEKFLTAAFKQVEGCLKPGGAFYIWHAETTRLSFIHALDMCKLEVRQVVVWIKNAQVMGRQDYHWQHEPCLYGWKSGAEHYFTFDRTQTTIFDDEANVNRMSRKELIEVLRRCQEGAGPSTVMRYSKPLRNNLHPTMKPIPLIAKLISNSSRSGDLVLDTFAGSGSTLIAAHQLGRKCYCMELDPRYADVIIGRWEALTEREAVRVV